MSLQGSIDSSRNILQLGAHGTGKRTGLSIYVYPALLVEAKEANQFGANS
jgi:hypothetical protein